jgi:Tfp pilus assembly protein PilF
MAPDRRIRLGAEDRPTMKVSRSVLLPLAFAMTLGLSLPLPTFAANAATPPTGTSGTSQVLFERGRKALDAQDFKAAVTEFERALVADPSSGRTYTWLGVAHARLGNQARAKKYFRSALDIDPNDLDALQALGRVYAESGDLAKAQESLDKIAKLCGECAQQKTLVADIAKAKANPPKTQAQDAPSAQAPKATTPGG